eukprot:159711-Prymnesium_polylepis.1
MVCAAAPRTARSQHSDAPRVCAPQHCDHILQPQRNYRCWRHRRRCRHVSSAPTRGAPPQPAAARAGASACARPRVGWVRRHARAAADAGSRWQTWRNAAPS